MFQKIKAFLFKNTSSRQTVAKNTIWLTISNLGGRLIKAIIIIYAARVLGTADYGVFSYALTLAGFLSLFMDPGINGILMRNAAGASDEERRKLFGTTFFIKILLLIPGIAIVIFLAPYFTTLPGAIALLPIVALVLALDTLREFFSSLFRAMEEMEKEALVFLITNVAIVIFGFLFLRFAVTAKSFGWGYVAGDALGCVIAIFIIRRHFKNLASNFSIDSVMPILKAAWPFAISGAIGFLFTNSDILIISWMRTASEVGIYSAAIRIVQTLYMVPGIIQLTTLPLLARLAKNNSEKFGDALERTLCMIFFASIPLAIGGVILGTGLMTFVFGAAYQSGGLAFKILMATLLFDFPASIIISALFVRNNQKSMIVSSAVGGVLNVVLDLALIPRFGMAGSAIATLIAQAANNWYLWHAMNKITPFSVIPRLGKMATAGIAMGLCAFLLQYAGANIVLNIVASAATYFFMIKLLKDPITEEILQTLPIGRKALS